MKRILAITLGPDHPSSRMRIAAYQQSWARLGWELQFHYLLPGRGEVPICGRRTRLAWTLARLMARLALWPTCWPILLSREVPVPIWPLLARKHPLVLDVDDAVYLTPARAQLLSLCARAAAVVCGNTTLLQELRPFSSRCHVIPTVVDVGRYAVASCEGQRLGWVGSSMSVDVTLSPWLEEHNLEVVAMLDRPVAGARFLPWSPAAETRMGEHFDIGLMPLEDDPYQAAKCGAKLLQYMAAGLPVVATPLGVNQEIVVDEVTGFHARTPQEWREAIARLRGDLALRRAMGAAGRQRVQEHYSVERWSSIWVAILDGVLR